MDKFNGTINFNICQSNVMNTFVQQGLLKVLKGTKFENMKEDDRKKMKAKKMSTIYLSLVSKVKYSVLNKTSLSNL